MPRSNIDSGDHNQVGGQYASSRPLPYFEKDEKDSFARPPLSNSSSIDEDVPSSYFCCSSTRTGSRNFKQESMSRKCSTLPHEPVVISPQNSTASASKSSKLKKKLGGYAFWKPKGLSPSGNGLHQSTSPTADKDQGLKPSRENEYQTLGPGDKPISSSRSKSFDAKKGRKIDIASSDSANTNFVARTHSIAASRVRSTSPLPPIPRSFGPSSPTSPNSSLSPSNWTAVPPNRTPSRSSAGAKTMSRSPPPIPTSDITNCRSNTMAFGGKSNATKSTRSNSFNVQRKPDATIQNAVNSAAGRVKVEPWYRKKCEDFDYDIPNSLPASKYRVIQQGSKHILVPRLPPHDVNAEKSVPASHVTVPHSANDDVKPEHSSCVVTHSQTKNKAKKGYQKRKSLNKKAVAKPPFFLRKSKNKDLRTSTLNDPGSPGGRSQRARSGGETDLPRFNFNEQTKVLPRQDSNRRRSSFPASLETDDYAEITEEDLYNMPAREYSFTINSPKFV